MATTTVRMSSEEAALLDELAPEFGGRSNALRAGLRRLAADVRRKRALDQFLREWETEAGPVDPDEVMAVVERYEL
jgi:Arc/MetJ-type ribon-helix-helix transcriptional regulator